MRDSTGIHWTPKERRIYDLLRKHPNTKITSQRLAREAQIGKDEISTLRTHIQNIRRKLKAANVAATLPSADRGTYMYCTMDVRTEEP